MGPREGHPPFSRGWCLFLDIDGTLLEHMEVLAHGNLEASVQEAMLRHLGKGGVFYDIGANLGFFALLGGHFAGFDEGHVYAFEPAPDNA